MGPKRGEKGFALLLVAIGLVTLSLIFATLFASARQGGVHAAQSLVALKLAAALDAAMSTAEHELLQAGAATPTILRQSESFRLGDIRVEMHARREIGKLDLNSTALRVLDRYFRVVGLEPAVARVLVGYIALRRGSADSKTGPETSNKGEGGQVVPFDSLNELLDYPGIDQALYDCIAPDLTVYTAARQAFLGAASQSVKLAMGEKASAPGSNVSAAAVTGGRSLMAGEVVALTLVARDEISGRSTSRELVIRVTGRSSKPFTTLAQTEPAIGSGGATCTRHRTGAHAVNLG